MSKEYVTENDHRYQEKWKKIDELNRRREINAKYSRLLQSNKSLHIKEANNLTYRISERFNDISSKVTY